MEFLHTSVMLEDTISLLLTNTKGIYVDCTLGGGGHSLAMAQRLDPEALLIGIDQDEEAIQAAAEKLRNISCRHILVRNNFSHIKEIFEEKGIKEADGFLFDLGVSSHQLDDGSRGFSYMHDGVLDMRMDQRNELTAFNIVNSYTEDELERVIREYGEERWARRIAKFICSKRKEGPIRTTGELVGVIKAAVPAGARQEGPHPAKRTFQAIRIEVNGELDILKQTMKDCVSLLKPGGRLAVITFQSLEDRLIKRTFQEMGKDCICPPEFPVCVCHHHKEIQYIGKALRPSEEELVKNPRARSATLRVVEKM